MKKRNYQKILSLIKTSTMPIGATYLSAKLELPQATIGRILLSLENEGLLEKVSNKGRVLTEAGIKYIAQQEQFEYKLSAAQNIIQSADEGSVASLYEIMNIRVLLEPYSAGLACTKISADGLRTLELILLENTYELKQGGIGNNQDLQFHLTIATESGNHTLVQILRLLLTQNNAYTKFSMVTPQVTIKQLNEHTDIFNAISSGNVKNAELAMLTHLKRIITDMKAYYMTH